MEMESLFNQPGWTRLTKEIEAEAKRLPDITFATAKCWEDVLAARERYAALTQLLAMPALADQRRANLERERQLKIEELDEL